MPIPTLNEAYFLSNSRQVDSTTETLNQDPNQVEMGGNLGHNFELNNVFAQSVLTEHPFTVNPKPPSNSTTADSRSIPEIMVRNSNEQTPQKSPLQIPIQELQKLQLKQRQNLSTQQVDNNANLNIPRTRKSPDSVRVVNSSSPNMIRPNPTLNETYLLPNSHPIDSTIKNLAKIDPKKIEPNKTYTPHSQPNPSLSEYGVNGQGSHFLAGDSWQMHEPHGGQLSQYHPVYLMHEGSPTLQPMTTVRVVGQPAAGGSGGYYNPGQRVTAPSDVRVVYRPSPPVPLAYSYQNVGPYEPVYYMQAPPVPSPQYDSTTVANVNSEDFHDTSPQKSKEQLGTSGSRGQ